MRKNRTKSIIILLSMGLIFYCSVITGHVTAQNTFVKIIENLNLNTPGSNASEGGTDLKQTEVI